MSPKRLASPAQTRLDDDAVVPEDLVGRLLDCSESALLDLTNEFSPHERANLAMFCYRKTHLRQIGLSIAAGCDLATLVQAWGTGLGRALYAQSRERALEAEAAPTHRRPKVTLARLTASDVGLPPFSLDDIDPEEAPA
jgi:hypothetical protein